MKAHRSFIRALTVLVSALVFVAVAAFPALSQESPEPSPAASPVIIEPGPPASYYASYGLIAIGGLTVLAIVGLYLFQAPGFRRSKGASS